VVTRDYSHGMKTAGVRDLKAHLSSYLREVQRGEVVLVTVDGRVVAELRSPGSVAVGTEVRHPRLVRSGAVRLAVDPAAHGWAKPPSRPAPPGTARALLDAERGE
jgi:antitoxin (DNA-binding transcriptional repressor) of toxin-antitoxin stability system